MCEVCDGMGRVWTQYYEDPEDYFPEGEWEPCDWCGGTGIEPEDIDDEPFQEWDDLVLRGLV